MSSRACRRRAAWCILGVAVAACATPPPVLAGETATRAALPFLVPGTTTRLDLLQRLGTPVWAFEDGRILTWHLQHDGTELRPMLRAATRMSPVDVACRCYGLVVILDARGVVERFSLVEQL